MADKTKHVGIIMSLVTRVHDALRASDNAVVGHKAYSDISKMMFLQFIHPYIKPGASLHTLVNPEAYKTNDEYPENFDKIYLRYMDIDELLLLPFGDGSFENTLMRIWDLFKIHPVTKIIFQDGNFFKAPIECIRECLFDINKVMQSIKFDQLDTDIKGVIYEHFVNGYADKGGKEFGQFFTPRAMVNLILDMNNKYFPDMKVETIYDPCMGTAGFLTEMYKLHRDTIKPENIYGGEVEPDTYSSGLTNLLLTTSTITSVAKCNSFYNNKNIKFDWICTNPPFGIKGLSYDKIISKPMYTNEPVRLVKKQHRLCASVQVTDEQKTISMKDLYPFKTNDATALFLQHCMYKLAYKGVCCIVLPDGKLITSGSFTELRKTLIDKYNVKAIISISKGTFEHTDTKTIVLIFTNDGTFTNIVDFYETSQDCTTCTLVKTASIDDIKEKSYSLYYKTYIPQETKDFGELFETKTLGELCEIIKGKKHEVSEGFDKKSAKLFPLICSSTKGKVKWLPTYDYTGPYIVIGTGGAANVHLYEKFNISTDMRILNAISGYNKYIYYYLLIIINEIDNNYFRGTTIKHITIDNILSIQIPLPSLELQKEIVDDCDTFESLKKSYTVTKALLTKKIQIYRKVYIDVLNETSNVYIIGDVCKIENGKRVVKARSTPGEYPVLGGGGYTDFYLNEFNRSGKTCKVSRFGLSIHNCVLILNEKYWLTDNGFTITSSTRILLDEYLWYYLMTLREFIHTNCSNGSGQLAIILDAFNAIEIPIPSLEKQKEIISIFRELYDEIDTLDKKIKQYDDNIKLVFGKYSLVNSTATENTMESAEAD